MRISAIAALDSKGAIGRGNQLLFKIPEDFARMKRLTSGHSIIMGRKTFESIGRPLPNRTNIIITRDKKYQAEGIFLVHSLEEALQVAKGKPGDDEVFIFGGAEIFKETLPIIDRLYLTLVEGDYRGDAFFPDYAGFSKVIEKEERHSDNYSYTFLTLQK